MISSALDRFYTVVVTTCTERPSPGIAGEVISTCTTDPARTSLWVDLAPIFALAAAVYAALGATGDYLEHKDKNFKERLTRETPDVGTLMQFYKTTHLRVGQTWQWLSKIAAGLIAIGLLAAYFFADKGPSALNSWLAAVLGVVTLVVFLHSKRRGAKKAVEEAKVSIELKKAQESPSEPETIQPESETPKPPTVVNPPTKTSPAALSRNGGKASRNKRRRSGSHN